MRNTRVLIFAGALLLCGRPVPGDDCNGNGAEDRWDIELGFSEDCNENTIPDECEQAPVKFGPGTTFEVTRIPRVVVIADLDDDGRVDVATGNQDNVELRTSTVSILVNAGNRGFETAVSFDAGTSLVSMVPVDLDGDGDTDLATANVQTLQLLENQGDRTFSAPVAITAPAIAARGDIRFITARDVTGDGLPDLITASRSEDLVGVLENQGGLAFADPLSYPVGAMPTSVETADLDGDGAIDLAVANRKSGDIALLLNRGDGTFDQEARLLASGESPRSVRAGDLDGDGDLDLAVATAKGIAFLWNDGTGRFDAPDFLRGESSLSLVVGDVNGDGDLDLAFPIVGSPTVSVLLNGGDGMFFPNAFHIEERGGHSTMAMGDLDGDGSMDLVVTVINPDRVLVRYGGESRPGTFLPEFRFPVGRPPHGADMADVNGDGHLDVVTGNNQASSRGLSTLFGQGDGTFEHPVYSTTSGNAHFTIAADLDGDGDVDVTTVNRSQSSKLQILVNNGSGRFSGSRFYNVAGGASHIEVADLDGDGNLDLVSPGSIWNAVTLLFNQGNGAFEGWQNIPVGQAPVAAVAADLDADGDADIAVANAGSSAVSVLVNTGNRNFETIDYGAPGGANFIVAADFDGDLDLDLTTSSGQSVAVLWNAGGAVFDSAIRLPIDQSPNSLRAADMDGDGDPDIVTSNAGDQTVSLIINKGDGTFDDPVHLPVGSTPRYLMLGDVDENGSTDIVSANHGSMDISVLINKGSAFAEDHLERICTERDMFNVSVSSTAGGAGTRVAKYILPASDDPELLPALFQNTSRFAFHEYFLGQVFPERFAALTRDEYDRLIGRRGTREYFVGSLNRRLVDGRRLYTFTAVADTAFDPRELLRLEEIEQLYARLGESFTLEPLLYEPDTLRSRQEAERWLAEGSALPIFSGDGRAEADYESYTRGAGYGRVRLLTLQEFNDASREGSLTFQDIVVIDQPPRDIEGVVGGVITAERQGILSHVALRTAQRGTPNAFVGDAMAVFADHEDMLVRLDVFQTEYCVRPASSDEAEEFWASSRPSLANDPPLEPDYRELDHLVDIDVAPTPVARHGGKASRFAALQQVLLAQERYHQYLEDGFSIPVHEYLNFMATNTLEIDGKVLSYGEYLFRVMETEEFQSDSSFRIGFLESFRDLTRAEGVVDPALVTRLVGRIEAVFGTPLRRLRFRSSSNVEDTLEFNGAGLYESTAVCAADTLDADDLGPSLCGFQDRERTIERALKKVWTSLWTFRAHEERWFYQIPQDLTAMGILVTRSFPDELVNGVALTGNPGDSRDQRYLVTAQAGEKSVVSPEPGVSVERDLLEVADGAVVRIIRSRASSLVPAGEFVLSEEQLRELGALMSHVKQNMPIDLEGHAPQDVLLDFEFKIEPGGDLAVKQVRPFLIPTLRRNSPTFELEIPPGTTVCAVFSTSDPGRSPREEYETRSTVRLRAGTVSLPTGEDVFADELFEEIRFGPEQQLATADGPGEFEVNITPEGGTSTRYTFDYSQSFTLESGEGFTIDLFGLSVRSGCDLPEEEQTLLLDEDYITFELIMLGIMAGRTVVTYSSCSYELLPLWDLDVELEGGSFVHLEERFEPAENIGTTGPASLVRAEVILEGQRQVVTDYWRLVYAARRHNRNVGYWVILDPPLGLETASAPVHVVEYISDEPVDGTEAAVSYLGENFEVVGSPRLLGASKEREARFRRGDVNADARLDIADVLSLLDHQFRGGTPPVCRDAVDANDDGRLNIGDAVTILRFLFVTGSPLPAPSMECGADTTGDDLRCEVAPEICK